MINNNYILDVQNDYLRVFGLNKHRSVSTPIRLLHQEFDNGDNKGSRDDLGVYGLEKQVIQSYSIYEFCKTFSVTNTTHTTSLIDGGLTNNAMGSISIEGVAVVVDDIFHFYSESKVEIYRILTVSIEENYLNKNIPIYNVTYESAKMTMKTFDTIINRNIDNLYMYSPEFDCYFDGMLLDKYRIFIDTKDFFIDQIEFNYDINLSIVQNTSLTKYNKWWANTILLNIKSYNVLDLPLILIGDIDDGSEYNKLIYTNIDINDTYIDDPDYQIKQYYEPNVGKKQSTILFEIYKMNEIVTRLGVSIGR